MTTMSQDASSALTRRMAKGTSIFVVGVVCGKVAFLLLQVLLGRVLGPEGYGLYSLGFSIVMIVQWVASLGLDWGVLRYCALHRVEGNSEQVRKIFSLALLISMASSLLVAGLLMAGAGFLARSFFEELTFGPTLRLFALSLPLYVLMRLATAFLQSSHQIFRMTLVGHIAQPVSNLLFVLGVITLGLGVEGAVGAFVVSLMVAAAAGVYFIRQDILRLSWELLDRRGVGPLLRYSLALVFVGVGYQFLLRIPNLLLGYLAGAEQVGVYAAAANMAMVLSLMPALFVAPFLPVIVELWQKGQGVELNRQYRTVVRWSMSVILPIFLLMILLRKEIMELFGAEYDEGVPILMLLSFAWVVYFAKGSVGTLLDMTGRQNLDALNLVVAGVLNVTLCFFLIPSYGAFGAAVATAATIIAWAGAEYLEVRLLYGLKPWSDKLVPQVLVTFLSGAVGLFLYPWLPWPFVGGITLGTYALLFSLFCLNTQDRELLQLEWCRMRAVLAQWRTVVEQIRGEH